MKKVSICSGLNGPVRGSPNWQNAVSMRNYSILWIAYATAKHPSLMDMRPTKPKFWWNSSPSWPVNHLNIRNVTVTQSKAAFTFY